MNIYLVNNNVRTGCLAVLDWLHGFFRAARILLFFLPLVIGVSDAHAQGAVTYEIACAQESEARECAAIFGEVDPVVADTSRLCRESRRRCEEKYGWYGIVFTTKDALERANEHGFEKEKMYSVKASDRRISWLKVVVSGSHRYLFWVEKPYRLHGDGETAVMFTRLPTASSEQRWVQPDTLYRTAKDMGRYDIAVESPRHTGDLDHPTIHIVFTLSLNDLVHATVTKTNVAVSMSDPLLQSGSAYPDIEVVGDSLYMGFVGVATPHTPKATLRVPGEDSNNVFLMSRHIRDRDWTRPRLVRDTGYRYAFHLALHAYGDEVILGYVETRKDADFEIPRRYRFSKVGISDSGSPSEPVTYPIRDNSGMGTFAYFVREVNVLLLEERDLGRTVIHMFTALGEHRHTIDIPEPVTSSAYYLHNGISTFAYVTMSPIEGTTQVEMLRVCPARSVRLVEGANC